MSDETDDTTAPARDAQTATAAVLARVASTASDRPLLRKWKFLDALYADPAVSDRAKVMAHALLSRYDAEKGYARRGYAKLAEMVGKDGAKAAQRAVDDLVEAGWFEKENAHNGTKHEVNKYRPIFDRALSVSDASPSRLDAAPNGVPPKLTIGYPQKCPTDSMR